jgi:hypothetical protein
MSPRAVAGDVGAEARPPLDAVDGLDSDSLADLVGQARSRRGWVRSRSSSP